MTNHMLSSNYCSRSHIILIRDIIPNLLRDGPVDDQIGVAMLYAGTATLVEKDREMLANST
jgi:hypothetical protein